MHRRAGHAAVTGGLLDGLRLAVGTLTVIPTPPPPRVDRRVASWAMTLAPVVGAVLAAALGVFVWLLGLMDGAPLLEGAPLLVSGLTIGLLALLTRAMHLDGLADTADGLGSGKPAAEALQVMRRGDIGPFGVVTLLLVVLLQVVALADLIASGLGWVGLLLALVVSRLTLPVLCRRGASSARPDGLGAVVVGTVSPAQLVGSVLVAALLVGVPTVLLAGADGARSLLGPVTIAAVIGLGSAVLLARRAVRRLGGLTGDVLGASVEIAFAATLVVLALSGVHA